MGLNKRAAISWLFLTALNAVDLLLYFEAQKWPLVNEIWIMRHLTFEGVVTAKLLMPLIVGGILLLYRTERIVKTMYCLCALYVLVAIWNVLQFIL